MYEQFWHYTMAVFGVFMFNRLYRFKKTQWKKFLIAFNKYFAKFSVQYPLKIWKKLKTSFPFNGFWFEFCAKSFVTYRADYELNFSEKFSLKFRREKFVQQNLAKRVKIFKKNRKKFFFLKLCECYFLNKKWFLS